MVRNSFELAVIAQQWANKAKREYCNDFGRFYD